MQRGCSPAPSCTVSPPAPSCLLRARRNLDCRDEAAADDGGRRAAELAKWRRVVRLLAATGGPYDPDADAVVQEELAEDRRREEAERQRRQEQQRVADRADELAPASGGTA
ncbi:hypothetical protein ACFXOM_23160 [Streptomyces sp. NPDC059169]|uniref:hypothetical protein n=1 Tax=Streptomyces sp. NPDC059169 TaxID=3346754 RepID=UPI0036AD6621